MTTLAFLAGLLVGGLTVGWASRKLIREIKAEALRLRYSRHVDIHPLDAEHLNAALRGDI